MNKVNFFIARFLKQSENTKTKEQQEIKKDVKTVKCNIQLDDCSCQPETAPRCRTCGEWRSEPCE